MKGTGDALVPLARFPGPVSAYARSAETGSALRMSAGADEDLDLADMVPARAWLDLSRDRTRERGGRSTLCEVGSDRWTAGDTQVVPRYGEADFSTAIRSDRLRLPVLIWPVGRDGDIGDGRVLGFARAPRHDARPAGRGGPSRRLLGRFGEGADLVDLEQDTRLQAPPRDAFCQFVSGVGDVGKSSPTNRTPAPVTLVRAA